MAELVGPSDMVRYELISVGSIPIDTPSFEQFSLSWRAEEDWIPVETHIETESPEEYAVDRELKAA